MENDLDSDVEGWEWEKVLNTAERCEDTKRAQREAHRSNSVVSRGGVQSFFLQTGHKNPVSSFETGFFNSLYGSI